MDWVDIVLRLGFPVAVVLMIIKGWLVPGFVYERVVIDNERMSALIEEKAIPALVKSNDAIDKTTSLVEELLRSRTGGLRDEQR